MLCQIVALLCVMASLAIADVSHILPHEYTTTTPAPPPHPYLFSYSAGRAPGHVDRTHTEVSDGSGTVRGSFSYVDPKQQVRTVNYVADKYGFHPELSQEFEQDTAANIRAKERHTKLYNRIAQEHLNPIQNLHPDVVNPVQSAAVVHATNRHLSLFEKIAQEHAQIGAEREAERLAFEATSERNQIAENDYYYKP